MVVHFVTQNTIWYAAVTTLSDAVAALSDAAAALSYAAAALSDATATLSDTTSNLSCEISNVSHETSNQCASAIPLFTFSKITSLRKVLTQKNQRISSMGKKLKVLQNEKFHSFVNRKFHYDCLLNGVPAPRVFELLISVSKTLSMEHGSLEKKVSQRFIEW